MGLDIGRKIQTTRKSRGITQEQLAKAVGVSAAAVSKWETAMAYPDILLLPPLARMLGVTVDELLDYKPSLTEQEVEVLLQKGRGLFELGKCREARGYCEDLLLEYPDDLFLKFRAAALYMQYAAAWLKSGEQQEEEDRFMEAEAAAEEQMDRAMALFEDGIRSENTQIREAARYMLAGLYANKGRLDDALAMLEQFPSVSLDTRIMKENILFQKKEHEESKKLAQLCLYENIRDGGLHLMNLSKIAYEQGNTKLAMHFNETALELDRLFEMDKIWGKSGNYYLNEAELCMKCGDRDRAFEALKSYTENMNNKQIYPDQNPYFDLLEWGEPGMSLEFIRGNMRIILEQDECFQELKDDPRYKDVLARL